jgi:alkyl sulfatase BDS1-like metallo-beta-lactamase superfamily hydrolase
MVRCTAEGGIFFSVQGATMKAVASLLLLLAFIQDPVPENPQMLIRTGQDQTKAVKVGESIYQAIGFGNTFLVTTPAGNVIIDTSIAFNSARHKRLLQAETTLPVKYIILTHAHGDHTGGVAAWKEQGTQVIAQKNHVEFVHYQARLNGFFADRNAAQFSLQRPPAGPWPGNTGGRVLATILFDDRYEFELGQMKFELLHTPGETPDHLTVWIPQLKAAFVGDNFYESFPNIYTLRGTQPRWALDYVRSIDKVLALKPEILLPSHGMPIRGNAEITKRLTQYRDAIQYVHDETVKGMNAGKDVFTLMREIKLPKELDVGESYGKLTWSVRGIYEGYAGWYDLNPATMYETPVGSIFPDLVKLSGGPDAVVKVALDRIQQNPVESLYLSDAALAARPGHKGALEARLKALEELRRRCRNSNERGWLDANINQTKVKLGM